MTRKERRILALMLDKDITGCRDAAESIFDLELEEKYPKEKDPAVREALYESDPIETQQKNPLVLSSKHEAEEFYPLIGFTLIKVEDVPEDGLYFTFQNNRNVEIEMLFDGQELFTTQPYGIDQDGNRIS